MRASSPEPVPLTDQGAIAQPGQIIAWNRFQKLLSVLTAPDRGFAQAEAGASRVHSVNFIWQTIVGLTVTG